MMRLMDKQTGWKKFRLQRFKVSHVSSATFDATFCEIVMSFIMFLVLI